MQLLACVAVPWMHRMQLLKLLVAITQALRVAHKLSLLKRLGVEHVDSRWFPVFFGL